MAAAEDYLGGLKLPRSSAPDPGGTFSFASEQLASFASSGTRVGDSGMRLKLGYKYSRFFAVESEFVDFGRAPADIFTGPGNLASAFRSTGFGVDTVATLPVWRSFSFYGSLGAYRGEARNPFAVRIRPRCWARAPRAVRATCDLGLGMRYDFSKARSASTPRWSATPRSARCSRRRPPNRELFSVGVNWRFRLLGPLLWERAGERWEMVSQADFWINPPSGELACAS